MAVATVKIMNVQRHRAIPQPTLGYLWSQTNFQLLGFHLVSEIQESVFPSLDSVVPALDPQVDAELRVLEPADCHMAPVTLAALCHLSKAGLACFKLSVAFCLGLAKLGRSRQGHRKEAVGTIRDGKDISNKPPSLEVLFISQSWQNFSTS